VELAAQPANYSGFLERTRRQEMKKFVSISLIALAAIAFSSVTLAAQPQPPGPSGNVIYGCYSKVNGQMRIVSGEGECRPSEIATSWNEGGTQGVPFQPGPSGVVATATLSGNIGTVAAHASQFVFAGPTVIVTTTTDTQRISGVAQAPLGTLAAGFASFWYDLCYRMMGSSSAPANFTGNNCSTASVSSAAGRLSFTAAASIVPGTGRWEVGYCVFNDGAIDLDNNAVVNGWITVTQ
jgi:hypothetical protein